MENALGALDLQNADARPWQAPCEPSAGTGAVGDRLGASCLHRRAAAVDFPVGAIRDQSTGVAAPVVCHSGLRIGLALRPFAYPSPRSQPFFSAPYSRLRVEMLLKVIQSTSPVLLRDRARGSGVVEREERVV